MTPTPPSTATATGVTQGGGSHEGPAFWCWSTGPPHAAAGVETQREEKPQFPGNPGLCGPAQGTTAEGNPVLVVTGAGTTPSASGDSRWHSHDVGLVHGRDLGAPFLGGVVEGELRDALRLGAGDNLQALDDTPHALDRTWGW